MKHDWYSCFTGLCGSDDCLGCNGGDGQICMCCCGSKAHGSLTSECCGSEVSDQQLRMVEAGLLDFKDGKWVRYGFLTLRFHGKTIPLKVYDTEDEFGVGYGLYYIGTEDKASLKRTRESLETYLELDEAKRALDVGSWTQRHSP